jgi:hypothetical protein
MNALRNFLFVRKHMKACRKLQQIVEQRRNSYEVQDYRKRRQAALKASRA